MNIKKFNNHDELVNFYISRGIENSNPFYFYKPIFSFVAEENNNIVGAITISKDKDNYIMEAVAVSDEGKGICRLLVDTVINYIKTEYNGNNLYLVAKNSDIFKNMEFVIIDREDAPDFSRCFTCPKYNKSCFPKIMYRKIR